MNIKAPTNEFFKQIERGQKVFPLYLYSFFSALIFYAPVSLYLRTTHGISNNEFFLLQVILELTIFLFEIPCGFLTDRFGYKKTIIFSAVILVIARVIFLFAEDFSLFALEAVIEGLAACFMSGTLQALMFEKVGEEKFSKTFSIYSNFGTTGFIISTASFYFIYDSLHLEGLLWLTIFSSIAAVVISFFITDSSPNEQKKVVKLDWKLVISKDFLSLVVGDSIVSLGMILINFFFVAKLSEIGIDTKYMTFLILAYSAVQLIIPKMLDFLEKFDKEKIYKGLYFLIAIFFILLSISENKIVVLSLMLFIPLITSLPDYYLGNYQNQFIDNKSHQDKRATILSTFSMGQNSITLFCLILFSVIPISKSSITFLIGGGLFLLVALFNLSFSKSKSKYK